MRSRMLVSHRRERDMGLGASLPAASAEPSGSPPTWPENRPVSALGARLVALPTPVSLLGRAAKSVGPVCVCGTT